MTDITETKRNLTQNDFFIVLTPTKSNKMDMNTMYTIHAIADAMDKLLLVSTDDSPLLCDARTRCLHKVKERFDAMQIPYGETVRALCIDDDISIYDSIEKLANVIKRADSQHLNILPNYHMVWTGGTIMNTIGIPDKNGEIRFTNNINLARLKDFEPLPEGSVGGLGFYYGDVNLNYKYHFRNDDKNDGSTRGEDVNFFLDNKLPLVFVDLSLRHEKLMRI